MDTEISDAGRDLIVCCEVGDMSWIGLPDAMARTRVQYEKRYMRPEWPGGRSGVTVGIGYDLGYATPAQIREDWVGLLDDDMIETMVSAAGVSGPHARNVMLTLRPHITVPWDAAIQIFGERSIPKYAGIARNALPNYDTLKPDCKGAIVSLTYNRGSSYVISAARDPNGRYREMRAIRKHMTDQNYSAIPSEFRAMKRLWPDVRGLLKRRDREAELFEQGLAT